ncbi:urease accessory protein UreD [Rhodalgimonas zhirmunskyi]|uniref:Urease accessory protein UreD n=1 Tax=Rhodalgimonas zhirmunskyi TaxID=2964767 RepID=A0AAJ1U6D7_9RHOB|nr:urease accessory protein UreD [Rhodoalgimonas zhirmunskyi]MDQ2094450.1 urease accessory protein UreD [Rhodoalgimonas zhirmunskyi]
MPLPDSPDSSAQPRARGKVHVSTKARDGASVLDGLRQAGSLKLLFPRVDRKAAPQAVLVNTAGGVTGGDRFEISGRAGVGTALTLTTQAAERAYRAQPGETGKIRTRLSVEAGGRIDWLPQETILYDGSALDRALSVDLATDARFLMVEPLVFGRTAMGETLSRARFRDRIEIRRGGVPLYLDSIRMAGDLAAHLARRHIADGAGAMVSLLYVAPEAEARLDAIRARLPETAGASLIRDGVLALRGLAPDSHLLRQWLVPLIESLAHDPLPRPWMT